MLPAQEHIKSLQSRQGETTFFGNIAGEPGNHSFYSSLNDFDFCF